MECLVSTKAIPIDYFIDGLCEVRMHFSIKFKSNGLAARTTRCASTNHAGPGQPSKFGGVLKNLATQAQQKGPLLGVVSASVGSTATTFTWVSHVNAELKGLREDTKGVKEEMKEVKEEMKEVKEEMKELRKELKEEMKEMRKEMREERKEMREMMKKLVDSHHGVDVRVARVEEQSERKRR